MILPSKATIGMTPRIPNRPSFIMASVIAAGLMATMVIGWKHVSLTNFWRDAYQGTSFGHTCSYATTKYDQSNPLATLTTSITDWTKQEMPYRGSKKPQALGSGAALLTKCHPSIDALKVSGGVFLDLGTVFGKSLVTVNGREKMLQPTDGRVWIQLSSDEIGKGPIELIVTSVLEDQSANARPRRLGLNSALPLVTTYSLSDAQNNVNLTDHFFWNESPALRMGLAIGFLICFAMAWMLGLRYPDVQWMVVVSVTSLFLALSEQALRPPVTFWINRANDILPITLVMALGCFAIAFMRMKIRPYLLALGFVGAMSIVIALDLIPEARIALGIRFVAPGVIGAVVFATVSFLGFQVLRSRPEHRAKRVRALAAISAFIAVGFILDALLKAKWHVDFGLYFTHFVTIAFAGFLFMDLVVFERRFLEQRTLAVETREESLRYQTVAATTQMLAHDARRPFRVLRAGMATLREVDDIPSLRAGLNTLTMEVDASLRTVEAMVRDILDLGGPESLTPDAVAIETMVEAAIQEVFLGHAFGDITFYYNFKHGSMAHADPHKVQRVIANLIENAAKAMAHPGTITVGSIEHPDRRMIEVSVHNSGTFIPPDRITSIFDMFQTSLQHGRGLGLAIAKRIVHAHGGAIVCQSDEKDGTTFRFTIPSAIGVRNSHSAKLPSHSRSLTALGEIQDLNETAFEMEIHAVVEHVKKKGSPVRMLVVDDEKMHRDRIADLIGQIPEFDECICLDFASDSRAALSMLGDNTPDMIISDLHLGPSSLDGFGLARQLRVGGWQGAYCIHSNLQFPDLFVKAVEAGATHVIPKPVSLRHLVDFVSGVLRPQSDSPTVKIAFVDDNPFLQSTWIHALDPCEVTPFTTAASIAGFAASQDNFPFEVVILDQYLDDPSINGSQLAALIRLKHPLVKLVLASDALETDPTIDMSCFDTRISKQPISWIDLQKLLRHDDLNISKGA